MVQQSSLTHDPGKLGQALKVGLRPALRFAAGIAMASLLIAIAPIGLVPTAAKARSERPETATNRCDDAVGLAVMSSPITPWKGAPLRVVFTVENALDGELSLIAPDGSVAARAPKRYGGPPFSGSPKSRNPMPARGRRSSR